ncbi:unnamed protein product [Amoebophrya sp. A120]|nr:unnamed protein product [Amoebophrya sp. A120]|eukprot:GSA120T00020796001.1
MSSSSASAAVERQRPRRSGTVVRRTLRFGGVCSAMMCTDVLVSFTPWSLTSPASLHVAHALRRLRDNTPPPSQMFFTGSPPKGSKVGTAGAANVGAPVRNPNAVTSTTRNSEEDERSNQETRTAKDLLNDKKRPVDGAVEDARNDPQSSVMQKKTTLQERKKQKEYPKPEEVPFGAVSCLPERPQLRWLVDEATAVNVCCTVPQRLAEPQASFYQGLNFTGTGYALPEELPNGTAYMSFYSSSDPNEELFRVPGFGPNPRSYLEFYLESKYHGWPSFRDDEVNFDRVMNVTANETNPESFGGATGGGEPIPKSVSEHNPLRHPSYRGQVSPNLNPVPSEIITVPTSHTKVGKVIEIPSIHLGHNMPDEQGNRYCVNLVCIAGKYPGDGTNLPEEEREMEQAGDQDDDGAEQGVDNEGQTAFMQDENEEVDGAADAEAKAATGDGAASEQSSNTNSFLEKI